MEDELRTLLTSAVGTTALIAACLFFSRHLILERLKNAVAHEYAEKIELLKAQQQQTLEWFRATIAQQQAIQSVASASLTAAHMAGHEKTLGAIEQLWAEAIRVRNATPLYVSAAEALLPHEYERAFAHDRRFRDLIEGLDELEETQKLIGDGPAIDRLRPFVGEYLYSLFFAYRAFSGRVAMLMRRGFRDGKVTCWHDDAGILKLLKTVLQAEEFEAVRASDLGRFRATQQELERKMLEQMARILSGEASATFGLQQARRIANAAFMAFVQPDT